MVQFTLSSSHVLMKKFLTLYNVLMPPCKILHPGLARTDILADCTHYSSIEKYTIKDKSTEKDDASSIALPNYPTISPPTHPEKAPTKDFRQPHHKPASKHFNSTSSLPPTIPLTQLPLLFQHLLVHAKTALDLNGNHGASILRWRKLQNVGSAQGWGRIVKV